MGPGLNLKIAWRRVDEETADQCITVALPRAIPEGMSYAYENSYQQYKTEKWKEVLMYCRRRIAWRIYDEQRRVQLREKKRAGRPSIREMRRQMRKDRKEQQRKASEEGGN